MGNRKWQWRKGKRVRQKGSCVPGDGARWESQSREMWGGDADARQSRRVGALLSQREHGDTSTVEPAVGQDEGRG